MTSPVDPALDVINEFVWAMQAAFNPDDAEMPPLIRQVQGMQIGGGSKTVRVFAGSEGLPPSLVINAGGGECAGPLLWVRIAQRYLSRRANFPAPFVGPTNCRAEDVEPALQVEVGVGRCSTMEAEPAWDVLDAEGEVSLDDSWRIGLAMDMAGEKLTKERPQGPVALAFSPDTVAPFGPDGGIVIWTGMAYVQYERGC